MDKQEILNRLDRQSYFAKELPSIKWNGSGEGIALCPFHEDKKPSLSINHQTGLYYCHACNAKGDIFDFHMKKHSMDFKTAIQDLARQAGLTETKTNRTITGKQIKELVFEDGYKFQRMHTYKKGNPQYKKAIFKNEAGDKQGRFFTLINEEKQLYTWGRQGKAVLYNEELLQERPNEPVMLCEGEHDSDTVTDLGFLAVTPGGVNDWKPEMAKKLKGRDVCILPHNDTPGFEYALKIATSFHEKAKSIKVIDATIWGDHKGADISDWIAQGGTKEKLVEIIDSTPEWISEKKRYFISIGDLLNEDIEPNNEIIEGFLSDGSICLLTAPSTHYKTWLALYIVKCIDENIPCLGRDTQCRKIYYIDRENPKSVLKLYCKKLGISKHTNVKLWPLWAEKEPPPFPDEVYFELAREKPLLVFDSQIRFYPKGTDENSASSMNPFMSFLRSLTKAGATILILHHAGKSESSEYRGSSDILGGVDIAYTIKKSEDDPPILTLKCIKSRFYPERDITIEVIADDTSLGFEIVQNPDDEILEAIHELLAEKDELNTNQIYELVKKELDIKGKFQVLKLLKKGEGKFWDTEKRGRAIFYQSKSPAIYSKDYKTDKKEQSKKEKTDTHSETLQSLDNTIKSNSPDSIQTIETNDVIEVLEVLE